MRRFSVVRIVAVAFLAGCASAQPDDDTTSLVPPAQVAQQSDQRLAEMQTAMTELLERLDVLNDRIARLENTQTEQRIVVPPLETGRSASQPPEPSTPSPEASPTEVPAAAGRPIEPQRALIGAQIADDYRNAIMLFGKNRMSDARHAFQVVFDAEPTGELADNALYWIGETYFAAGDFANAMRYYNRVTSEFAEQNKAPDALYKTGVALAKTGDLALARKTFEQVVVSYPYSTFAASAKQELKRIKY